MIPPRFQQISPEHTFECLQHSPPHHKSTVRAPQTLAWKILRPVGGAQAALSAQDTFSQFILSVFILNGQFTLSASCNIHALIKT